MCKRMLEKMIVIGVILKISKLRQRGSEICEGHTANRWQQWDPRPLAFSYKPS